MSVFESLLNKEYTIDRRSRVSDGGGGWAIAYEEQGAVQGRMRPASSQERDVAAQEERRISHVLYVVASTNIVRGDQVSGDGITVDVVAVREPSRADHHLEIDCWEKQAEVGVEVGS